MGEVTALTEDDPKPKITKRDFILSYFKTRPGQPLSSSDVADWVQTAYKELTGRRIDDPNRIIRYLYARGIVHRETTGIYVYYPGAEGRALPPPFTDSQKRQVYARDGRVCAICGTTEAAGDTLDVDHIRTRDKGGESVIENGQVLCTSHNQFKKNYGHTETAKRFFKNLYRLAVKNNDLRLMAFIEDIMEVYERHGYDDHITWSKDDY